MTCAIAVAGLLLGAGAEANDDEVASADVPRVGSVRFRGVESVSSRELKDYVLTSGRGWKFWTERQPFDEETLREDLDRIAGFYRERGYYVASALYTLETRSDGSRVDVEIEVNEGPPVRVVSREIVVVETAGLSPTDVDTVTAVLGLAVGEIFSIAEYNAAKDELRQRLGNLGYPASRLTGGVDVDLASHGASLHWQVDPGPIVRFGEIRIEGLEEVAPEIVERSIPIRQGEVFANDRLRDTQRRIYGLDLFRSVEVIATDPEDGSAVWPVTLRVRERDPRSVRISVGYGTEDKFRAKATWIHRNFFGDARRLDASARYSSLVAGGDVQFVQPRFPDWASTLRVDAALLRETPPAFTSLGVKSGFLVQRPITGPWSVWGGYRVDFRNVENAGGSPRDEGRTLLSYFQLGLTRTTVDDRLQPTRGTFLEFSLEPSLQGIGSDVDYLKMQAEARWFQKFGFVVFATRVRWGATQPFGSSEIADVPIFERFFSGGSNSVRGFRYQHLGPFDGNGNPVGGLSLAEASFELRFPIYWIFSGVAFVDTGQVVPGPFDLRWDEFRSSAGPGLRVATPIGDLRVDYGRLLNPREGDDSGRVHLSIGQAF